jgi:xylan 1,4-beta-xylosidase
VNYALGTNISSTSTSGFSAALSAAANADVVIYAGGIDDSIEAEALDRNNITWPSNQLQLISELAALKNRQSSFSSAAVKLTTPVFFPTRT